jgi:hypothetical protein
VTRARQLSSLGLPGVQPALTALSCGDAYPAQRAPGPGAGAGRAARSDPRHPRRADCDTGREPGPAASGSTGRSGTCGSGWPRSRPGWRRSGSSGSSRRPRTRDGRTRPTWQSVLRCSPFSRKWMPHAPSISLTSGRARSEMRSRSTHRRRRGRSPRGLGSHRRSARAKTGRAVYAPLRQPRMVAM